MLFLDLGHLSGHEVQVAEAEQHLQVFSLTLRLLVRLSLIFVLPPVPSTVLGFLALLLEFEFVNDRIDLVVKRILAHLVFVLWALYMLLVFGLVSDPFVTHVAQAEVTRHASLQVVGFRLDLH